MVYLERKDKTLEILGLKMKKLFILMFCMILLLGSVSAVEWNDKLTYSNTDLKVSLENWWGLGKTIGTAELKSHGSVTEIKSVPIGNSVVMWYDIDFKDLYKGGLGNVEIINVDTGELTDKNYEFVYWGEETYQVPNYVCNDVLMENGTTQEECYESGTKDKTRDGWVSYNSRDLPKGKITLGVKVNMFMDETFDVVWEIGGKKIKKHAVVSSGAVETTDGDFTILTFSNNGTFNVTGETLDIQYLIIGGGGAGGGGSNQAGGGGGGGYLTGNITLGVGDYNISVGLGGSQGNIGQNSSINTTLEAWGGGDGGNGGGAGGDGGSGGGGGWSGAGGNALQSQGEDGGDGDVVDEGNARGSAGGGGSNEAGSDLEPNAVSQAEFSYAGRGGNGTQNAINGTNVYWAGGGGGGGLIVTWNTLPALGGLGGGGDGGSTGVGDSGVNGTGGAGGGSGSGGGGNGGSGKVIIRFVPVLPTANITLDAPANNTNFTLTNNVVMNATIFDDFNITNVTLWLDDQINETNTTAGLNNTVWTFTKNMGEVDTFWTLEACNFNNTCINASQRTYNVNTTPNIQYGAGVPANYFNTTNDLFEVNVTITESLFKNLTFDLYNRLGTLNQSVTFTNSSREKVWGNLPDGNYSYNVTTATSTNQFNSTATRNISFIDQFTERFVLIAWKLIVIVLLIMLVILISV